MGDYLGSQVLEYIQPLANHYIAGIFLVFFIMSQDTATVTVVFPSA